MTIKGDIEMTATYYDVQQVYGRNYGSERLYKRNYCSKLLYTEGLMDFQQTLDAYWVIDNMVSYMPTILQEYKDKLFSFHWALYPWLFYYY